MLCLCLYTVFFNCAAHCLKAADCAPTRKYAMTDAGRHAASTCEGHSSNGVLRCLELGDAVFCCMPVNCKPWPSHDASWLDRCMLRGVFVGSVHARKCTGGLPELVMQCTPQQQASLLLSAVTNSVCCRSSMRGCDPLKAQAPRTCMRACTMCWRSWASGASATPRCAYDFYIPSISCRAQRSFATSRPINYFAASRPISSVANLINWHS